MQAAVVPVLVPSLVRVGASMALRSLFRLPPYLLRIVPVGHRNVRSFRIRALHGNLRGCRSFHAGYYPKDGNIVRRVVAPGYVLGYCLVSGIQRSMGSLFISGKLTVVLR